MIASEGEHADRQTGALATMTGTNIASLSAGKTSRPAFAALRHWKRDLVPPRNLGKRSHQARMTPQRSRL